MPLERTVAPPPAEGPPPQGRAGGGTWLDFAVAAACASVTFVVFLPAIRNGFLLTWDDGTFIVRNPIIGELSASTLRAAFTDPRLHYWAPLTWLSLAVDHRLWGLDPVGFHLTNVILHAGSAALAFLVARRIFGLPAAGLSPREVRWGAAVAALAWSFHPLRVESVAWATQRKDVLSLFFGLAAILAYLGHLRSGAAFWRSRGYVIAFVLFCLSLLSKPLLVTLPLVLWMLDAWSAQRTRLGRSWRATVEKIPLLAVAAGVGIYFAVSEQASLTFSLAEMGLFPRALVMLRSLWDYLAFWAWPAGLSPFYLQLDRASLGDPSFALPAAAVLGLTAAAIVKARERPALAAAWFAWLVALAPGLRAAQVSWTYMADRFTYFAALPLTLLAVAGAVRGLGRLPARGAAAGALGLVACLALLAGLTVRQISYWRDDVALWTRPIELNPRFSGRVYTQRSMAREARGDWSGAREDMDQAIAIAGSKNYGFMQNLFARRARILARLGLLQEAVADYGRALDADASPDRAMTLRERAGLYRLLGMEALAAADEGLADRIVAAR